LTFKFDICLNLEHQLVPLFTSCYGMNATTRHALELSKVPR